MNMLFPALILHEGKYSQDDVKIVVIQILNVVAFCPLQCVVHRDLKPQVSSY